MKYMLLIYCTENLNEEERQECYAESQQLTQELHSQERLLGASPLQPASISTCIQVRQGKQLVTDGPFVETREQLGGYFLVEARDLNEAIAIAARIPAARTGTVEVRPLLEIPGIPSCV
jgi:hypothetical protein